MDWVLEVAVGLLFVILLVALPLMMHADQQSFAAYQRVHTAHQRQLQRPVRSVAAHARDDERRVQPPPLRHAA
ncbi:MAG TPA: hypothetical protein VN812_14480 [Candidatus Acidoferrales bacterium]|nr:hypothetical protein [Candidatus Acidoferrales bacterium]